MRTETNWHHLSDLNHGDRVVPQGWPISAIILSSAMGIGIAMAAYLSGAGLVASFLAYIATPPIFVAAGLAFAYMARRAGYIALPRRHLARRVR